MAISAVFTNHFAAVDACNELGDIGLIVEAGRDKRKGVKKETQLIIDIPWDLGGRPRKIMAKIEGIVTKYEGRVVR